MRGQPTDDRSRPGEPHGADDLLLELAPIAEHLRDILDVAAAELRASCAVMLRNDGRLRTAATSDTRAEAMSDWQFVHGAGPSLEAMDDSVAVYSSPSTTSQWPGFARVAAEQRCSSSLSIPLLTEASTIGALTAYRDNALQFTPADQQVAQQFAEQAAGAVAYLLRIASGADLSAAVAHQSVIDTAVGILMVRGGHDGEQALAALRADATARGVQLSQAAIELVSATSAG